MTPESRTLFGIRIDSLRMNEAIGRICDWVDQDLSVCRYVVTPNVDHAVLFHENAQLRAAYRDSAMTLADGYPLVWASRWLGQALPERVPGSDLVPGLFTAWDQPRPLRIFLLGAGPGVALRAAERIRQQWPSVQTVDTYCPPLGFERSEEECETILTRIAEVTPDVLVVGLGAPKQEIWVHRHQARIRAKVALCVGATIDFLAGEKKRAPRWMQKSGVEWLHRMCTDPKRLVKRYARDAWVFPRLVWQQLMGQPFTAR